MLMLRSIRSLSSSSYLVLYRGTHGSFRLAEWDAACSPDYAELVAADPSGTMDSVWKQGGDFGPTLFMKARLASDDAARRIASRSVLIRYIVRLWGSGDDYESCAESLRGLPSTQAPWRICSVRIGSSKGRTSGEKLRNSCDPEVLGTFGPKIAEYFTGPVDLVDGERVLVATDNRERVYCGHVVGRGNREILRMFSMKDRKVLGPTTMPIQTAAVMARLARVEPGHTVLDPFAGSAGCLLATTYMSKSPGIANDIKQEPLASAVRDNFAEERGLPRPRVLPPCDIRKLVLDDDLVLDAIVTDPPYGKREFYSENELEWLSPLLALARTKLRRGGRLVFFMPPSRDADENERVRQMLPYLDDRLAIEAALPERLDHTRTRTLLVVRRTKAQSATT